MELFNRILGSGTVVYAITLGYLERHALLSAFLAHPVAGWAGAAFMLLAAGVVMYGEHSLQPLLTARGSLRRRIQRLAGRATRTKRTASAPARNRRGVRRRAPRRRASGRPAFNAGRRRLKIARRNAAKKNGRSRPN